MPQVKSSSTKPRWVFFLSLYGEFEWNEKFGLIFILKN